MSPSRLVFIKINENNRTYETLLELTSQQSNIEQFFQLAKLNYSLLQTDEECVLELQTSNEEIMDSISLSYEQLSDVADLLGYQLPENKVSLRLI